MGRPLQFANTLLAIATLALVPACTTNDDASIIILHNQAPSPGCVTTATAMAPGLSRGRIDARSPNGYLFTPVVQNFTETGATASLSQRIAFIQGANVSVSFVDSELFSADELSNLSSQNLTGFSERFSIEINPDGGVTAMQFFIIPQQLLRELENKLGDGQITTLLASIQLFGKLGGGDIESQEFVYPVDVCDGCVVNDLGSCSAVPADTTVRIGGNCFAAQDAPVVDCCSDADGLLCPALPTGPTM